MATSLARLLESGAYPYARLISCFRTAGGNESFKLEVDVERPQRPVAPINRCETLIACFIDDLAPSVYAVRQGFPADALHLNMGGKSDPPSICLDDRSWSEARIRWTAFTFVERIRWWLAGTARGDLHGADQAPEPVFFPNLIVILPAAALRSDWPVGRTLEVHTTSDRTYPNTILLGEGAPKDRSGATKFFPVILRAQPQVMQRLRNEPENLKELHELLTAWGIDILAALRAEALRLVTTDPAQLQGRPLILLYMPLLWPDGSDAGKADIKAFITSEANTVGSLGVALGCLIEGAGKHYVRDLQPDLTKLGEGVAMSVVGVQASFDREIAATASGFPPDDRKVTIVGAGAIGSHLMEIMRRDGFGIWTAIDNDALLPHNLQRHTAAEPYTGQPKAFAAAEAVNAAIGRPGEAVYIVRDVLRKKEETEAALEQASLIIDASASIPVARFLSDHDKTAAPRASVFFNIVGKDVVLLGEPTSRDVTLDALESQYYRAVLDIPELKDHIAAAGDSYRYAGSCRSVSFRMPESHVSMLSGAISGELRRHLVSEMATITVWASQGDAGIARISVPVHPVQRQIVGDWEVVVDNGVLEYARSLRQAALPAETGGILLGTIDVPRRKIGVVKLVPAPADSAGDAAGFERGTKNLAAVLADANKRTAGQVEYVGEWHSHPTGCEAEVSPTDVRQLVWLGSERLVEALPAIMMIFGDGGEVGTYIVSGQFA